MAPLLRRAAANDDRAFERLYQRHVRDVYRYSLAVLGQPSDAEDVTQTTFLNAYRAFRRGERPEKPENWLITIAHNVCRQRFRQQQRRPHEVEYEDEIGGAVEPDDSGPTADDLLRAFQQLPPNQREALVMRELEGRTYKEIAQVLEISVSALETLLFRARRALREQLEEQITCSEAERSISKQLDGRLPAAERRALRAHLRSCPECSSLSQSQRAQRRALRTLLAVPLPSSLSSFSSLLPHGAEAAAAVGTTGAVGGGVALAAKVAAVVAVGTAVGGGAYEGAKHVPAIAKHRAATTQAAAVTKAAPTPRVVLPALKPLPVAVVASTVHTTATSAREGEHGSGGRSEKSGKSEQSDHGSAASDRGENRGRSGEHRKDGAESGATVAAARSTSGQRSKPERAERSSKPEHADRSARPDRAERASKGEGPPVPAQTTGKQQGKKKDGKRAQQSDARTGRSDRTQSAREHSSSKESGSRGSGRGDEPKPRERDRTPSAELEVPPPIR